MSSSFVDFYVLNMCLILVRGILVLQLLIFFVVVGFPIMQFHLILRNFSPLILWCKIFTGPGSFWWSWNLGFLERCITDIDYGTWQVTLVCGKRIPLIVSPLDHRLVILPYNSCFMKPCWRSWSKAVPRIRMVTVWLLL